MRRDLRRFSVTCSDNRTWLPLSSAAWGDSSVRRLFVDVQRPIAEASWTSHGKDSDKDSRWQTTFRIRGAFTALQRDDNSEQFATTLESPCYGKIALLETTRGKSRGLVSI